MATLSRSFLLTDLSWVEVRTHLDHDRRLIVPVGACDQYGPHLPLGSGTCIAAAIARELSQDFGILRAPVFPYGVAVASERLYAGTATLTEKTLHRLLNELLASWQDHGFAEFILITASRYDPHVEALATVSVGTSARIRVIDVLDIDLSSLVEGDDPAQHGGEVVTSLMLYLDPDKVNLEQAQDYVPGTSSGGRRPGAKRIPAASPGSVGRPSLASAGKGRRIYQYIVQKIRSGVFLDGDDGAEE